MKKNRTLLIVLIIIFNIALDQVSKFWVRTNVLAGSKAEIKANLISQLTAPVRWTQSVEQMIADGATLFTEVGPGKVLQGLVKKINREAQTASATIESAS